MSYDLLAGLVVPLILLLAGGISKKLVRGKEGFFWADFYLEVELTLGATTSGLLQMFDVIKAVKQTPTKAATHIGDFQAVAIYLVFTFMIFLFVVSLHQIWEHRRASRQKFWSLGILANSLGFGLMVSFFLFVKGVH